MAEKNCITYLIGNKIDLLDLNENNREVSIEEAQQFAKENGLKFYEASALTSVRINDCFEDLLQEIYNERRKIKGNLNEPVDKNNLTKQNYTLNEDLRKKNKELNQINDKFNELTKECKQVKEDLQSKISLNK